MLVPVAVANRDDRCHRRVRLVELARRDVVALVGAVFDQITSVGARSWSPIPSSRVRAARGRDQGPRGGSS